jgi:dipeptide/tripeptide permease
MDFSLLRQLPRTLFSAVIMELFERLAYYGMALVLGIYVVDHLGIPVDRYGWVYGVFTGALYLLPLLAGALADRFGYKPALAIAFATLTAGYFVLGAATSFGWLCVALGLIAVGGSIIKPTISGTVTRTTVEGSTRPVGFGLYYMMINAGGLIGPVIAAQVRNRTEFRYVFWVSAAACALMLASPVRLPRTGDPRRTGGREEPGQGLRRDFRGSRQLALRAAAGDLLRLLGDDQRPVRLHATLRRDLH